jgi:hypothetical protein
MVLLLAGVSPREVDYEELAKKAIALAQTGMGLKQAVAEVAGKASKSVIYDFALRLKP